MGKKGKNKRTPISLAERERRIIANKSSRVWRHIKGHKTLKRGEIPPYLEKGLNGKFAENIRQIVMKKANKYVG